MNLGKPETAGPILIVVGVCFFIGSLYYKFSKDLPFGLAIKIPLVIGIALIIYGAFYLTGKTSECVLSGSGTCSTSCGQGLYSGYTIKENAAYGGNCDLNQKVPCYNSITCGSHAVELGPYDMAPWTNWNDPFIGDKSAKWVWVNASGAAGSSDTSMYSFLNASRSTLFSDTTVTLDVKVDDVLDDVFWNSSSLKSSINKNKNYYIHIKDLPFRNINNKTNNGYNTLDIRMHNTGGGAGVIYSVIDTNTNLPYMISSSSTTFKYV